MVLFNNIGGVLGPPAWTPATAVVPANYLQLTATANSSGQLVIKFMNRAASEGDLAGFKIRTILEPSTDALLVTGAMALLSLACRARHSAKPAE